MSSNHPQIASVLSSPRRILGVIAVWSIAIGASPEITESYRSIDVDLLLLGNRSAVNLAQVCDTPVPGSTPQDPSFCNAARPASRNARTPR